LALQYETTAYFGTSKVAFERPLGVAHSAQVCFKCDKCRRHFRSAVYHGAFVVPTLVVAAEEQGGAAYKAGYAIEGGGAPGAAGCKCLTHIDYLIAIRNNRKEQTRRSCPSNLAAPLTLRWLAAL
jgi:hypothetical protein